MDDTTTQTRSLDLARRITAPIPLESDRIALSDRLSLRLGLWLLLRSARRIDERAEHDPQHDRYAEHTRRRDNERARDTRESAQLQEQLLHLSRI
ncbi:hypothetical protein ACFQRL_05850 [Microbacterium fluvii]|uniref:Uncharacterized protein n=1 Tax=Microbacterium fluvii TaxID=415215 RepID=A0ABW2HDG9_9MICO|nr:hypothetical protein [Microbacterium fluvii]MCU4672110.1 hypothetical protein [Microbacterium fluvii]